MTTLPATEQVDLELEQGWLNIWLDRPKSRNILTAEMTEDTIATLAAVNGNAAVRGITFRDRDSSSCAIGDIEEFKPGWKQ